MFQKIKKSKLFINLDDKNSGIILCDVRRLIIRITYICVNIQNKYNWEVFYMSEERDDILILVDEKGEEVEFEYLDTMEVDGNEYAVLLPLDDDDEDVETEEVVILKLDKDENGEDSFVSVDDDEELNKVFELFKKKVQEEYGAGE